MKTRLFLVIFIALLFSLGGFKTALAQGDCENVHCTCVRHHKCEGNTGPNNPVPYDPASGPRNPDVVYGNADPKVNCGGKNETDQKATYWERFQCNNCGCCDPYGDCKYHLVEVCASWESCGWGFQYADEDPTKEGNVHSCSCDGSNCVLPPEQSLYYDNPLYPEKAPIVTTTPDNIYLPVKLDWEDIQGWVTTGHYFIKGSFPQWFRQRCTSTASVTSPNGYIDCVNSYRLTINDLTEGGQVLNKALPKSEYNYRDGFIDQSCKKPLDFITGSVPFLAPILLAPARDAVIAAPFTLVWTPPVPFPATSYIYEISDNSGFYPKNIIVRNSTPLITFAAISASCLRPDTYYWWRVTGCNLNICGNWSPTRMFKLSSFEGPCFLESNHTYNWQVQACCSADGGNCGPATSTPTTTAPWIFYTNPAPEPVSPADPNWNGTSSLARNVVWPSTEDGAGFKIEWCGINDCFLYGDGKGDGGRTIFDRNPNTAADDIRVCAPEGYNLYLRYVSEPNVTNTDKYKCEPDLATSGKCIPITITADESNGQYIPYNAFFNERYRLITKLTSYAWRVAACKGRGSDCTKTASQENTNPANVVSNWLFSVQNFTLKTPTLLTPSDDPTGQNPQGFPVFLSWEGYLGAMSFRYSIDGVTSGVITKSNLSLDFPQLAINTLYTWHVTPCWDFEGTKCENFSTTWHFKTGGSSASCLSPPNGATNITIPVEIIWNKDPIAKSYYVEVKDSAGIGMVSDVVYSTSIYLNYPTVEPGKDYFWTIQACADADGLSCGPIPAACKFTTCGLTPVNPATLSPANGATVLTGEMPFSFSWGKTPCAKFYNYSIYYTDKAPEETGACPVSAAVPVIQKTVPASDVPSDSVSLNCLGEYVWKISSCLDGGCTASSTITQSTFKLSQGFSSEGGEGIGGLVPCGRVIDDPNTPWNERDKCEIKHIFLSVKIIIDFLLWKVGIILLAILAVLSGVIYYFSMGSLEAVSQVRLIWKAAGIGYGVLFLGWLIINIFLMLFGYNVGIFGPWYQFNI